MLINVNPNHLFPLLFKSLFVVILYNFSLNFSSFCFKRDVSLDFITWSLILVSTFISINIKSNTFRYIAYFWCLWPIIGILNSGAWVYLFSSSYIDIEGSLFVYQVFLIFFIAFGLLTNPKFSSVEIKKRQVNLIWFWLVMIFPFLMALQSIINIGGVPLFSGVGFVTEMYLYDYGFLYSYKFVMLVSMLLILLKIISEDTLPKYFWFLLLVLSVIISLFDGKRVVLLSFVFSSFLLYYKFSAFKNLKLIVGYCFAAAFIYVFIGQLRSGELSTAFNEIFVGIFYTFGVEYRDYSLTFTNFNPGEVDNYDWFMSSLAALINSSVASVIGFDKNFYSSVDSARAFMNLYEIEQGIRTGIISELWFAYGWLGLIPISILGLACKLLCEKIDSENDLYKLLYLSIIYSFVLMSIMGQSSVFFGLLITLLYIYLAHSFLNFIFPTMKKRI